MAWRRGYKEDCTQGRGIQIKSETWLEIEAVQAAYTKGHFFFFHLADNQHVGSAFVKKNYGKLLPGLIPVCAIVTPWVSAGCIQPELGQNVKPHRVTVTWSSA